MTTQGPRLIFRFVVPTTAELLAQRLRSYRRESGWLVGEVWHELSPIRDSEDPQGHTKLLLTDHTDGAGTVYPASIRYALDDLQPWLAARVSLIVSAYLHSQAVISYTYQVLSNLFTDYPETGRAEYSVPFVLKELPEDLHGEYARLINWFERHGGRRVNPLQHVWEYAGREPDMSERDYPAVTWLLDTGAGTFSTWLLASWPDSDPIQLELVTLRLGRLRQDRASTREDGSINLVMGGSCQCGESEQHFGLEEMLTPVIRLVLLPLTADRVEARLSWRLDCDGLRAHLVNVLDAIAARWPELRRTIQGPIAPTHKSITYSPRPKFARPYPWETPFGGPIEPTPQVLANWERLQQESLGRAPQALPTAHTPKPAEVPAADISPAAREEETNEVPVSEAITAARPAAVMELAADGISTPAEAAPANDDRERILAQARELRPRPGMTARELACARVRILWPCEDITISEIARVTGYGARWVKRARIEIGLPPRPPGRKRGQ